MGFLKSIHQERQHGFLLAVPSMERVSVKWRERLRQLFGVVFEKVKLEYAIAAFCQGQGVSQCTCIATLKTRHAAPRKA
jgi:hypothetical protein